MNNKGFIYTMFFLFILTLTSCSVIADIFQAGMGVGIFLVLLVIAIIVWIVVKIRRKS